MKLAIPRAAFLAEIEAMVKSVTFMQWHSLRIPIRILSTSQRCSEVSTTAQPRAFNSCSTAEELLQIGMPACSRMSMVPPESPREEILMSCSSPLVARCSNIFAAG